MFIDSTLKAEPSSVGAKCFVSMIFRSYGAFLSFGMLAISISLLTELRAVAHSYSEFSLFDLHGFVASHAPTCLI